MDKKQALDLIKSTTKNHNLIKHMLAVGACMKTLAGYFGEDKDLWEIAGIVHDADYDMFAKTDPKKHPSKVFDWLEEKKANPKIIQAVKAHAWGWRDDLPEPKTKMDWSLYCCDELTGFIIAVALVRPEKKLNLVFVENILKKWNKKDFAKGVHREQIELCQEKLGIKLEEFIRINLEAMQGVAVDLGL